MYTQIIRNQKFATFQKDKKHTYHAAQPVMRQKLYGITGHCYVNFFQVINSVPVGTKQGQAFNEIMQVQAASRAKWCRQKRKTGLEECHHVKQEDKILSSE